MMMLVFGLPVVLASQGRSAAADSAAHGATISNAARSIAPYFIPATSSPKAPDAKGFLRRWLLLEPINKPNPSNTVFSPKELTKLPVMDNPSSLDSTQVQAVFDRAQYFPFEIGSTTKTVTGTMLAKLESL